MQSMEMVKPRRRDYGAIRSDRMPHLLEVNRHYRECPVCGAHLDPGEKCDCEEEEDLGTGRDKPCGV